MKCKVLRTFRDKYTGQRYAEGDTIEVTEERADEILSVGEFIKKPATRRKRKTAEDAAPAE